MAGNNNKKFLFRQPGLDPERDQPAFLPFDIASWLDTSSSFSRAISEAIAAGGFGVENGFPGGMDTSTGPVGEESVYDTNPIPGLTAKQPQIVDIVKQEVVQDPQGNATVTVTFSIGPEQDNIRYELRLSKA